MTADTHWTVLGLRQCSAYTLSVIAVNDIGESIGDKDATNQETECLLDPPANVTVDHVGGMEVLVSWETEFPSLSVDDVTDRGVVIEVWEELG